MALKAFTEKTAMNTRKQEQQRPVTDQTQEKQVTEQAHKEAEKDIARDPDLSIHSPNDDLDEGELARLGEDKTDIV
jgi:hypothetical protein